MQILSAEQKTAFVSELKKIGQDALISSGKSDYHHMLFIRWTGKFAFVAALFACFWQWYITSSLLLAFSLVTIKLTVFPSDFIHKITHKVGVVTLIGLIGSNQKLGIMNITIYITHLQGKIKILI